MKLALAAFVGFVWGVLVCIGIARRAFRRLDPKTRESAIAKLESEARAEAARGHAGASSGRGGVQAKGKRR